MSEGLPVMQFYHSKSGGVVTYVSADGEVIGEAHVPAGLVRTVDVEVPEKGFYTTTLSDGLVLCAEPPAVIRETSARMYETAAVPSFQSSSAFRAERTAALRWRNQELALQRMASRMESLQSALDASEKVAAAVAPNVTEPAAPAVEPAAGVVE